MTCWASATVLSGAIVAADMCMWGGGEALMCARSIVCCVFFWRSGCGVVWLG